jgi:hypothetical protein
MFPMYKLKKASPFITATLLAVAVWLMFAIWIVMVFTRSYDFVTIIIVSLVALVFASSATGESIRAYCKWRRYCQSAGSLEVFPNQSRRFENGEA